MNNATKTANEDSALRYKGFPSIKVGHFYKMECKKDVRVVAYCASEDRFVVKTGSTFGLDDYPELARDDPRPWIHVVNDWTSAVSDYIEAQGERRAVFKTD